MKEEVLNAIKTLKTYLGMEVKLEQLKLVDGAVLEADSFVAGQSVFIVTPEGDKVPAPVGEHELEDGRILVITEEGIVGEIKEKMEEEPQGEVEVEASAETTETTETATQPKKVIESKEYHFSQEEIKALVDEVENLKKEIIEMKAEKYVEVKEDEQPTDVVEFEQTKPINFNPENTTTIDHVDLTPRATMSRMDEILNNIYK